MSSNPFMQRAIELSRINVESNAGGPFGAVIVKDGKIIGEGWNQVTTLNDPTAHAEVQAIRHACANIKTFDLQGAEVYTSCEPCPMCLSAIYWARCSKIYYGNTKKDAASIHFADDFIYEEIAKPYAQRSIPLLPMMREEALQIFKIWEQKVDKIPY